MQVLSASVSMALNLTKKVEYEETAKFCLMFDKFFDCMNTRQAGEGKRKRKPDLDPYRSDKDVRLLVSCILYFVVALSIIIFPFLLLKSSYMIVCYIAF